MEHLFALQNTLPYSRALTPQPNTQVSFYGILSVVSAQCAGGGSDLQVLRREKTALG